MNVEEFREYCLSLPGVLCSHALPIKSNISKIVSLSAVWLRQMSPTSFNRVKLMTPAVFFLSCFISSYSWSYCLQLKVKLP